MSEWKPRRHKIIEGKYWVLYEEAEKAVQKRDARIAATESMLEAQSDAITNLHKMCHKAREEGRREVLATLKRVAEEVQRANGSPWGVYTLTAELFPETVERKLDKREET